MQYTLIILLIIPSFLLYIFLILDENVSEALELLTGLADCRLVLALRGPMFDTAVANPKVLFAQGLTLLEVDYPAKLRLND